MPRTAEDTRTRILDAAETLILDQGFAATSIDKILVGAGITKGAFFYHFKTKADLAHALVERFARLDADLLERYMTRAEKLAGDPLQQVLVFIGLFEEQVEAITEPVPGCLFASYCYESSLFDDEILEIISRGFLRWRDRLGAKISAAMTKHPPRRAVDAESLADLLTTVFEGAYIMSRSLKDPKLVAGQLAHYRNYVELLFSPEGSDQNLAM
jgi:TetR/AcrR family transcriptional repressor of nem operon